MSTRVLRKKWQVRATLLVPLHRMLGLPSKSTLAAPSIRPHYPSVSNQLNRLYLKFLKRNPGYDGKVSLYGHSLGSVLSYDILCHQENLSSPFPMEWIYKKHTTNEESSPSISNQSSECTFTSGQNKNALEDVEGTGMCGPTDEDNANEQTTSPVLEKEHTEDSFVPTIFSNLLDLDKSSASSINPKQPNAISSLGKDAQEQVSDCDGILSYGRGNFNEDSSMNYEVLVGDSGKVSDGVSEIDNDKVIKLLREEIDSLKAKITELEPQRGKVGSPLGVFLALRNSRIGIGKGQDYLEDENIGEEMPACRQMFNIFHPFDPVAFRIEPLICKEYIRKRPVIIPYHKGGKRLHIGLQEFAEDLALRSQAIMDHLNSVRVKVLTICQSRNQDSLDEASDDNQEKIERSYGSIMLERLTGSEDGRIDHMLQDKTFQHPYISVIGSHTNYWRDYDTALFILKHLYRYIPEEPELLEETKYSSSKNKVGSEGWSDQ